MTAIANCRGCGGAGERVGYMGKHYFNCRTLDCCSGPVKPTAEEALAAWNALMAAPPAKPEGAGEVKIPVYAYADGRQIIHMQYTPSKGWYDVIHKHTPSSPLPHAIVTAYIAPPRVQEVEGAEP